MSQPTDTVNGPVRPSKAWYWIGGTIALVGGVLQVFAGIWYFVVIAGDATEFAEVSQDDVDALIRLPTDGEAEVRLPEPGRYFVYVESASEDPFEFLVLAPEDVTVEPLDGGEPTVPVQPAGEQERYERGGNTGGAQLEFEVEEAGNYAITVSADPNGPVQLFVGPEIGAGTSVFGSWEQRRVIIANLLTGSVFVVGKVILIITAAKRSAEEARRRKARAMEVQA